MLEVVAVLALMGVMGSMLFRQIYQRNQELHNIQMATLSKLLIFDFPMNMSDVHTLMWKPWCVLDRALFNANSIKYAAHKNHYTCPRPEYIYNSHGNLSRSFRHPTSSSLTY